MSINPINSAGQKFTRNVVDWRRKPQAAGHDAARRDAKAKTGTQTHTEEFPWTEWVE